MKKVNVIGLGYIGLPTATTLSDHGFDVHGVDTNEKVVSKLSSGKVHIIEKNLDELFIKVTESKSLTFSSTPSESDVFIITVPTPLHSDNSPNTDYIFEAAKSIAPFVKNNNLIILESTSPVGTTEKLKNFILKYNDDLKEIYVAHCPERVLPGNILNELIQNNRVVGGVDEVSTQKAVVFYKNFVKGEVIPTTSQTAEMVKLTENSYRDINIAFANELSIICDKLDIDVNNLIEFSNKHPRVNILHPGPGVGGHCIAVDPWFIINQDKKNSKLIRIAREVNSDKENWVVNKINDEINLFYKKNNTKPIVACFGLAYKPNIDDMRESPAEKIALNLLNLGHNIIAVDPNISNHSQLKLSSVDEAIKIADIKVFLVAHNEFIGLSTSQDLDFCNLKSL